MTSTSSQTEHPPHLAPSELGTKDYWETFYARTLTHLSQIEKSHDRDHDHGKGDRVQDDDDVDDDDEEEEEEGSVNDDSDPGTSWFSEHNAPEKVLRFLTSKEFPLSPRNTRIKGTKTNTNHPRILDLGTGNGSMLALLRRKGGFRGEMVGVDYSKRSVELARELQRLKLHSAYRDTDTDEESEEESESEEEQEGDNHRKKKEEEEEEEEGDEVIPDTHIRFEEWDILGSSDNRDALSLDELGDGDGKHRRLDWFPYEHGGFDIVLDKGTFDAVSLSDQVVEHENQRKKDATAPSTTTTTTTTAGQVRVCELYPAIAKRLVRRGGFLVVTSCNWTEEELIRWFTRDGEDGREHESGSSSDEDRLIVWGKVEYPRFRFGGQEGQGVCTVCFQRQWAQGP